MMRTALAAALLLLAACTQPAQQAQSQLADIILDAREDMAGAIADPVEDAQRSTAEVLVPLMLDAREAMQETLPAQAAAPAWAGADAATRLIVRWEVTSEAVYTRKYEGVICPGGASGPTWAIGYDGGHQTPGDIRRAWHMHPDVERLATASGVIGDGRCRAWRIAHRDLRIPYAMAARVFRDATLPAYHASTRRAFANGWARISGNAQAADVSLVYNRGASMKGDRNREKRAIRDDCIPTGDHPCNASQLRGMCRLWAGTPNGKGLCARRDHEARLVLQ